MKVYLQESFVSNAAFNAGSKARNDCDCILENCGYKRYVLYVGRSKLSREILRIYNLLLLSFKLKRADVCLLQYPYYSYLRFHAFLYKWILMNYKGKVECLLHDIQDYRERKGIEEALVYLLQKCDKIIVHTPAMRDLLVEKLGIVPGKIRILYLFDYLTESPLLPANPLGRKIIFAGNLNKSAFLKDLGKLANKPLSFNLYGASSDNLPQAKNCVYRGKFQPDDVAAIEGDWGLVWDGDTLETCGGNYGEYLKINSSHKISLYLSAGKPVIIWAESSLCDFIVRNHLGIAVHSLYEINEALNDLSEFELKNIQECVAVFAKKLRAGNFLKNVLNE